MSSEPIYWARFEKRHGVLWRFDTRIYAKPIDQPRRGDRPLGCIIGKNPGSARPRPTGPGARGAGPGALEAIELGSDRFLPTVRAIVHKSHDNAGIEWPERHYVQVFNLFYLCNRNLGEAKASLAAIDCPLLCPGERRRMPWTWFAWGGPDALLDPLKDRFRRRRWRAPLYYDNRAGVTKQGTPTKADHARHTQGMPHERFVGQLADILEDRDRD